MSASPISALSQGLSPDEVQMLSNVSSNSAGGRPLVIDLAGAGIGVSAGTINCGGNPYIQDMVLNTGKMKVAFSNMINGCKNVTGLLKSLNPNGSNPIVFSSDEEIIQFVEGSPCFTECQVTLF